MPGEQDLRWSISPKLPNLPSIKSRKLKKKHLFDFLRIDRVNLEHSLKEQSFPMNERNSIEEDIEEEEDNELDEIPDIEVRSYLK